MGIVTANELKTQGMSALESHLAIDDEVTISVRGQDKYVVMNLEKYNKLREYELAIAVQEARSELAAGEYKSYSVSDHMKQIADDL